MKLHWLAEKPEWIEETVKPLFVVVALLLYAFSLGPTGVRDRPGDRTIET